MTTLGQTVFAPSIVSGPTPGIGHVRAFLNPLKFLRELAHRHPQIAYLGLGRRRDYLIFDADLVGEALDLDEKTVSRCFNPRLRELMGHGVLSIHGTEHHEQRKRLKPLFFRSNLESYSPIMVRHGLAMTKQWKDGQTVEVVSAMLSVSFDIITDVLFGRSGEEAKALSRLSSRTIPISGRYGYIKRFVAAKFRHAKDPEVREMTSKLNSILLPWIETSRSSSGKPRCPAIVHRLVEIHDGIFDEEQKSDRQTRDELISFLFAGHETTAMAVSWALWLVSQDETAERGLQAEIDSVIGDSIPMIEHISRLKFTRAVLREAMRLYPPVWLVARRTITDCQVGSREIPARSFLHISPYAIQRDERYYDSPDEFRPGRFLVGPSAAARHKHAYIPFGGGSWRCMGDTFAQIEGVLLLACVVRNWRVKTLPGQNITPQPLVSLRPKYGIKMSLHRRS
ncbi:MAG TPA: cytochrome P450 [Pyrinomonadaceae bacterium]